MLARSSRTRRSDRPGGVDPAGRASLAGVHTAVRYCRSPAGRIAYSVTGAGPALLLDAGWVTHLRAQLDLAAFGEFLALLAARHRVIRFDKPGCGLSDRDGDMSFEAHVGAALAVVDAVGADRFSVFGASQGGHVAAAIAARHPARVESLVLYGTCARGADLAPPEVRESLLGLVAAHWGLASRLLGALFFVDPAAADLQAFARLQQQAASAAAARRLLDIYYQTDVTDLLTAVRARTLVLHREADTTARFELGRQVAGLVPGATLIPLPGAGHLFYHGQWRPVLEQALAFLAEAGAPQPRLTAREYAVARLVASGLTNRSLAARLSIAPRTADTHVENIRRKLGARSRAQIAAWITEHPEDTRHPTT
jgi:pimeloyl-ACP methyl ester carboxylesterase/DNA-binding CsgD family transcriptional regulator